MLDITQGPWKASDRWGNFGDHNRAETDAPLGQVSRFSYSIADESGFIVAHCNGPNVTMSAERSEANAKLIAAAPEIFEALVYAEKVLRTIAAGETNTPIKDARACADFALQALVNTGLPVE